MSKPTPPDGSDPRVLSPSPDEPDVTIVQNDRSSSDAYHTYPDECDKINTETHTRSVKQSIAEWQGKHLCGRCAELEARPGPLAELTPADRGSKGVIAADACATLREHVAAGHDPVAVGDELGMTKSCVYRHLRGEVSHEVPHPPLAYTDGTWTVVEE